jgi:hypothetical protein
MAAAVGSDGLHIREEFAPLDDTLMLQACGQRVVSTFDL